MAELRELFEMTTKQMEPDQDSWRKQEERHHRADRRRKFGTLAVAAAVGVVTVVGIVWNLDGDEGADGTTPATTGTDTDLRSGSYLVDLRTGRSTPIENSGLSGDLDVSSDGTRIAFGEDKGIVVADLDGTNVREFDATRQVFPEGEQVNAPRWSPDGGTIVYQGDGRNEEIGNLFALDVASGEVTQLTDLEQIGSHLWYMSPSYSPDGGSILFTSPRGPCGSCTPSTGKSDRQLWHLWSIPSSGGEPTIVVRDAGTGEYSPDGSMIAYTQISRTEAAFDGTEAAINDLFTGDLWIANANGSDRRQLAAGELAMPRWSPDGTKIAYSDDGRGGTYVVDVDTGKTTMIADAAGWAEWVDDDTLLLPIG
jgi:Tol biopolymer transport system component